MATPTSTPRPHAAPSRTPRSNNTAVHTPTPMSSVTSPPAPGSTPATLRSIASPAYLRSNLAKASPLSHALGSVTMSRNPTSTSEVGTNGSIGTDAHTALMEKTGLTPAGMGMNIGLSPLSGGNAGTNGLNGVGVRDPEEERRRKMEDIVAMIGTKWGRVCQEGLERAAKRVGLECLWEEGRGGNRTLSIAGNGVLVDVEFILEEVKGVTLEFMASGNEVGKRAADGAEVLKRDLQGDGHGGYVMLDAFVSNLERLAKMDKLSEGGTSCFDAVEGIRADLEAVFELEAKKTREEKGPDAAKEIIDREVLCQKSGRPKMHTGRRVGLALQYWVERSFLLPEMLEQETTNIDSVTTFAQETDIYSAIIETETSTLQPPNVQFVAKLEPPVVVPLQIAADIYQTVGAPQPTTYESLLFKDNSAPSHQRTATKQVASVTSDKLHRHLYTLFALQPDYGCLIEAIPFSDIRQILNILPVLRQWAHTGSLLRQCFTSDPSTSTTDEPSETATHLPIDITLSTSPSPPRIGGTFRSTLTLR